MEDNINVKNFYENSNEDEREDRESLEFCRSKKIITRYLTHNAMDIADVGGATGAYSFWLADMGHTVHLLDLVQNHIDIAKRKSQEKGLILASCLCADARELPYDHQCMDMVLLMGALYHLHSSESRIRCLTEAFRVLKLGGMILCTVMNRYNVIIAPLKYKLFDDFSRKYIEDALNTGIHEKANFYAHTPNEVISELSTVGFHSIQLFAVEGIANALGDNQIPTDEREASRLLWSLELTESIPELIGVSRNIMAVGRKPLM